MLTKVEVIFPETKLHFLLFFACELITYQCQRDFLLPFEEHGSIKGDKKAQMWVGRRSRENRNILMSDSLRLLAQNC